MLVDLMALTMVVTKAESSVDSMVAKKDDLMADL